MNTAALQYLLNTFVGTQLPCWSESGVCGVQPVAQPGVRLLAVNLCAVKNMDLKCADTGGCSNILESCAGLVQTDDSVEGL